MSDVKENREDEEDYDEYESHKNMQYDRRGRGKLRPGCACSYCDGPSGGLEYEGGRGG